MTSDNRETRLAATYEALRRREYDLISEMLEVLPRIDHLGEERIAQVRDARFHADHPFLMVFVGPFSSGKSSLINALMGEPALLRVGPTPTTDRIQILRYGDEPQRMDSGGEVDTVFYPSPLLKKVSFVDTPGLESVFQKHEETTRRFLHRSDVVLLVMLATQVMTSRNVEYMQQLREYGKKVILVINQADLVSTEDAATVRTYVLEQSQDKLGFQPEVWLLSARKGLAARSSGQVNEEQWRESGLHQIEEYIDRQLDDAERMRQKLQTPLQILQNVNRAALDVVKSNQAVLDQYQGIADNVQAQLTSFKREQDKIVRETLDLAGAKFDETGKRSREALRDIFQLSHAVGSVWRGFWQLIGIGRLFRRRSAKAHTFTRLAFEKHKVFEPIRELPAVTDRLAPRLEGKDMQDVDDLVGYSQREVNALPPNIRGKVIGAIQPPAQYDRSALQAVRADLERIEGEALEVETDRVDGSLRNVLFMAAVWEVLMIVVLIILVAGGVLDFNQGSAIVVFLIMVGLIALGLLAMPIAGRVLQAGHYNRLMTLRARYLDALTTAADKQVEYGMQLRRDVVAPLTRLVEAQTQLQTEQLNRLQRAQNEINAVEAEIARLGKRGLFGLRG